MSTSTLYGLSAVAGVISGMCIIVGAVFNDLVKNSKGTIFNFMGALIGLFGITGFYLWQREEAGLLGVVGYAIAFIGMALIACIDFFGTFVASNLSEEVMSQLAKSPTMQVTSYSFMIFLLGAILFGMSTIIAGVFSKVASVLFMIGFLATPLRPINRTITFIGLTLSGIGLIWWGISLWILSRGG